MCDFSALEPTCNAHRCPWGNCLTADQICNGRKDCNDGSDEDKNICNEWKSCQPSDFRCSSGKCVPKTKFCDNVSDCEHNEDEPDKCNCLEYLK